MIYSRLGHIPATQPSTVRPEIEIDILEIGKKILIKQTNGGKQFTPVEHRTATSAKNLASAVIRIAIRLHGAKPVARATSQIPLPCSIQDGTLMVAQHFRGEIGIFTTLCRSLQQYLQAIGLKLGIIVQQKNKRSKSSLNARIDGGTEAGIFCPGDEANRRPEFAQKQYRIIRRTVIDNYDLIILPGLAMNRGKATGQHLPAVAMRDDDINQGRPLFHQAWGGSPDGTMPSTFRTK